LSPGFFQSLGRREESLAVQSAILTGARAAGFLITIAVPIVLVRVFDQATFGIYKQLFLIVGTVIPILDWGLYASLFYFVPRDRGDGHRFVLQTMVLMGLSGGIVGIALAVAAEPIASLFGGEPLREYLPLLGLVVFLGASTVVVLWLPVVDRRPMFAAYTLAGSDFLRSAAIVAAALVVRTVEAVLWAVIAVIVLRGLWLLMYLQLRRVPGGRSVNRTDLKAQLRYALPFGGGQVFEVGFAQFHQYYVAAMVAAQMFAVYAIGVLHIPIIGMLTQSVTEVTSIRAAQFYKAGDLVELRRLWRAAISSLTVLLVPAWALAELYAFDMIVFLFGPEFSASVPVFRLFVCSVLLMIIVDHSILRATGDTPYVLKANAVGFGASVLAVIVLGSRSVLLGAVTGFLIGMIVIKAMGLARVARRLEVAWWQLLTVRVFARTGCAVLVSGLVAASAFGVPHRFLRLAVGGLLFLLVYGMIVLRWELVPRPQVTALLRRLIPAYRGGN
jgi:O-antigen/teichoic acid export membrane protein